MYHISGNENIDFLLDNILLIAKLCILLRVLEKEGIIKIGIIKIIFLLLITGI